MKTSLGTDEFIEVGCSKEEYCVDVVLESWIKLTKNVRLQYVNNSTNQILLS
ncbi:MAG: hypothetical protein U0T81_01170 [Saprospiraceae bacterium]